MYYVALFVLLPVVPACCWLFDVLLNVGRCTFRVDVGVGACCCLFFGVCCVLFVVRCLVDCSVCIVIVRCSLM